MEAVPLHRLLREGGGTQPKRRGRRRALPPVIPVVLRGALAEGLTGAEDPRIRGLLPLVTRGRNGPRRPAPDDWEGLDPWTVIRIQRLAHDIRRRAADRPAELVGMAWGLREPLDLDPAELTAALRGHLWSEEESEAALETARATLEVFRRLDSPGASVPGMGAPVRELNPAAGTHRITTDPRELEAALRAGERSWAAVPYYRLRYGDRGAAFTRSDSAWLVTLCNQAPEAALEQALWLGRILSVRGMPRWLLEEHLRLLHRELESVGAGPGKRLAVLVHVADALAEMRQAHLSDARMEQVDRDFAAGVGPELAGGVPMAGALLAGAWADAREGLPTALPALTRWLGDPERFPPRWVQQVALTLDALDRSV